jgi:hypothetical protein
LTTMMRAGRDEFFPGSQHKPALLRSAVNQLRWQLPRLSPNQLRLLATQTLDHLNRGEVLAYSPNPELQTQLAKLSLTGHLETTNPFLYLVEANVGINKANRFVSREITVNSSDYRTTITINWRNGATGNDQREHGYVNYQRLLVPTEYQLVTITVNQEAVSKIDTAVVSFASGQSANQFGHLITVPAGETTTLTWELTHPRLQSPQLHLYKQPGLIPSPYTVSFNEQTQHLILDRDTILTFETK